MLTYKDLKLNNDLKIIYIGDELIMPTKAEYNLLYFFLTNRNMLFSRDEIIENVWKSKKGIRIVDVTISTLRKKLKEYGKNIVSRTGFGYAFIE